MNINTTTDVSPAVSPFYDKSLLARTLPYLLHDLFADRRPLPKGESDQIRFRQYTAREPALVPISEGVVPDGGLVSTTEVDFTLEQFGDYLKYTDKVSLTQKDPFLSEFVKLNSEQAKLTIDIIRREAFVAGTQVRREGGAASRAAIDDIMDTDDLKVVERALLDNQCEYMSMFVDAQKGYATTPTRPAFFCISHTDAKSDIEDMTGFLSVEKYQQATKTYPSEIGQVGNFRFLITNKAKKWADTGGNAATNSTKYTTASSSCDVYATLVFSEHAVAVSDLAGEGLRSIIKSKDGGGPLNPLNQFGTVGWVSWLAQGILDETRLYRIEHAVSAL